MTRDEFWEIIEEARRSAGKTSEIAGWLEGRLSQLPEAEIVDFGSHFRECQRTSYDARLWLAASVILGGCGDDSFSDFRGWLIAQGRKVFETALADPDSLAELELERFDGDHARDPRMEAILYVDTSAFCRRAGRDDHDFETRQRYEASQPPWSHPALKNEELLKVSDDDASRLFPKLAARFPTGIRPLVARQSRRCFPLVTKSSGEAHERKRKDKDAQPCTCSQPRDELSFPYRTPVARALPEPGRSRQSKYIA